MVKVNFLAKKVTGVQSDGCFSLFQENGMGKVKIRGREVLLLTMD